ncbi:MAG: L-threonylcarbamoyladenylate synthase [Candidatus Omnitrophica bacterium]|nr:L-threonylcarbamoyladenylate synthase [Candidatus Omnitrophota bacterium]
MIETAYVRINDVVPDRSVMLDAVKALKKGGIVAFPTETVYGLAADSRNKKAIRRLYEIKQRPDSKPFSLLVGSKDSVDKFSKSPPMAVYKLMAKFWPGPLTIVMPSGNSKVGLRMPDNVVALMLISESGLELAAPSANIADKAPCLSADEVMEQFSGKIDIVLDGGEAKLGRESTVVEVDAANSVTVLREGAIKAEDAVKAARTKTVLLVCTGNTCRSVMAEGLLKQKTKDRLSVEVVSAGISALSGMPATAETLSLLSKEGIDMSGHKSRRVSMDMLKSADLILVMERIHKERIKEMAPEIENKVFLLKEFAKIKDGNSDIKDPIGGSIDTYMNIFYIIKDTIERISKTIL